MKITPDFTWIRGADESAAGCAETRRNRPSGAAAASEVYRHWRGRMKRRLPQRPPPLRPMLFYGCTGKALVESALPLTGAGAGGIRQRLPSWSIAMCPFRLHRRRFIAFEGTRHQQHQIRAGKPWNRRRRPMWLVTPPRSWLVARKTTQIQHRLRRHLRIQTACYLPAPWLPARRGQTAPCAATGGRSERNDAPVESTAAVGANTAVELLAAKSAPTPSRPAGDGQQACPQNPSTVA